MYGLVAVLASKAQRWEKNRGQITIQDEEVSAREQSIRNGALTPIFGFRGERHCLVMVLLPSSMTAMTTIFYPNSNETVEIVISFARRHGVLL